MAPFLVQIVATMTVRWFAQSWRDAVRFGHFSGLKHDLVAMIPPPFTGELSVVYFTGEAAWSLAAMLVGFFPANVYAAITSVTLGNCSVTSLWVRTPLQLFLIALLLREAIVPTQSAESQSRRQETV